MLQEIGEKEFHNEYISRAPENGDICFVFSDREVMTSEEGKPYFLVDLLSMEERESLLYLYRVDEMSAFLWIKDEMPTVSNEMRSLHDIRMNLDEENMYYMFSAYHLYVWYRDNKFCGRCGKLLSIGKKERNLVCSCKNTVYPKIAPAVIVAVKNGDRLLLTQYANRPYKNWALIAGFCEFGETLEDTVRREVMEEAGLKVKNIKYFSSQPWGIDSNLLMGFYCDVDGDTKITVDEDELSIAEWFDRADIPERESLASLTATMMDRFKRGMD